MKKAKTKHREAHTPSTHKAMGDYYGTGIKNPVGRAIDVMGIKTMNKSVLKKKPKSLA